MKLDPVSRNAAAFVPIAHAAALPLGALLLLGLSLPGQTVRDIAMHACNRITFGPTPPLMTALTNGSLPVQQFITDQLQVTNPGQDPNPRLAPLEQQLEAAGWLPPSEGAAVLAPGIGLTCMATIRAAYAEYQLNEVMTRFWNDHFNRDMAIRFSPAFGTNGDALATWFMRVDDDYYREHALDDFAKLLEHTAASVSMLIYLDNWVSTATNLNENWGRELIELFTMGERNQTTGLLNYNQADVVGVSKCFTGWTVLTNPTTGSLFGGFVNANHDTTAKSLFAGTPHPLIVQAGGSAFFDGDAVLTHLAGLDATADYVVRKLMILFFGDDAPSRYPGLLAAAKQQWGPRGDIRSVLRTLLLQPEFLQLANHWQKIKNPLRFNVSMLRAMDAQLPQTGTMDFLAMFTTLASTSGMGQSLYEFPSPDGYPLTNPKQLGVGGYADRVASAERVWQESTDLLAPFYGLFDVDFDPAILVRTQLTPAQQIQPTAVASFLLQHFFADKVLNPGDLAIAAFDLAGVAPPTTLSYRDAVRQGCELIVSFTHFALH